MTSRLPWRRVALFAGMLSLLGCSGSPEVRESRHIAAGKQWMARQDFARAVLEFRGAIQAVPADAEAYYQLGLACAGAGDFAGAVGAYRKAIELNPKHQGARLSLASLMSMTESAELLRDAERRLKALLNESDSNPEVLNALGLTELKLGKPEDAAGHLERALALAPRQLASSVELAQSKLAQKDYAGAEATLRKACESAPRSAEARLLLGDFYQWRNRPGDAEQQFRAALALEPANGPALLKLALLENSLGRKQEAGRLFQQLSAAKDHGLKPAYGLFLFGEGRKNEAVREFERLAKEDAGDRLARTRLVAVYQAVNRTPEAERLLDQALRKNPKDLDAMLQRGELAAASGNYRRAEQETDQVLRLSPNAAEAHYVLAKLHQARGERLIYRQELSEVLRLNPYLTGARLELARDLLANNGARAALEVLNETPEFQRRQVRVVIQRNWALWSLGDLQEMRKGIDLGLSQERPSELLLQDGLWKLRAGDFPGARSSLGEALKANPGDLRALGVLTEAKMARQPASLAVEEVRKYAAEHPDSAPVQEFLGNLLLGRGDRVQARTAFMSAKSADGHFTTADFSLVQLDILDGKLDNARKRLETVLAAGPNATARLWLGNLEELAGNHGAATAQFRKAVEADPANAQALNNLAYLLAEYGSSPDEALKYAQKALELAPERPDFEDTMGWILYRKGLYGLSLSYLEHAAAQKQVSPVCEYHLAMAYAKAGNPARGRAVLEAALRSNPKLPEAAMAKAVVGEYR